jgi:predicted nucleic-acid-binding protein
VIGIDTNVIVRFILQDDAHQSKLANTFFEGISDRNPGFLSLVCLTELVWVLESFYAFERRQVVEVLSSLVGNSDLKLERPGVVAAALQLFKNGKADFADCLIERTSANAGCERTMTFDRAAARTANMVLIK